MIDLTQECFFNGNEINGKNNEIYRKIKDFEL